MLYPYASLVESILAQRCQCTHEDPEIHLMWTVNQANWSDWPKDTQKKCPIKIIQSDLQAQLGAWPSESAWEPIHKYCTIFPLNKYLTGFTTFCLHGKSFLQSLRARTLVTVRWSRGLDLVLPWPRQVSGWEPKSWSKRLQAEATRSHVYTELSYTHSDGRSCKFTCTYTYIHRILGLCHKL